MHLIFNIVDPTRHFKRGVVFDADVDKSFPLYNPTPMEDPDWTGTDDPGTTLMPYLPISHLCVSPTVYRLQPLLITVISPQPYQQVGM